jgi:hypothetical protein
VHLNHCSSLQMIDLTSSPEVVRKSQVKSRSKNDKAIIPPYKLDSASESDASNIPQKCKNKVSSGATGLVPTHLESNAHQLPPSQQEGRNVNKSAKVAVKRKTLPEKVPLDNSGKKVSDLNLSDSDESVFQKEAVNDKKKAKKKPSRKDEKFAELSETGVIIESGLSSSTLGVSLKDIFDEKSMKVFDVSCPSAPGLIRW